MGSSLGRSVRTDPQITRHIKVGDSLEKLERDAELGADLVASPGWPLLERLVNAEIATIDAELDRGLLDSKADYAFRHGRRGGLAAALQFIPALLEHAESEFDKQRERHEGPREGGLERVA